MPRRNPIVQADLDDEEFVNPTEFAEEEEEEFGADDVMDGDPTDEDVQDELRKMDQRTRDATQKSVRRGGAPTPQGPKRTRETAQQAAAKTRNPARGREEWKPDATLEAPPPLPGNEGRWIRFRIGHGEEDQKNFSSKRRGLWEPRKLSTVPQGYYVPTMKHSQLGEIIAVGDLIYCERPLSVGLARRRYFAKKLQRQTQAGQRHVRHAEREDHPIESRLTRGVSRGFGKKRRVAPQEDE
jgi:hypothetical protein